MQAKQSPWPVGEFEVRLGESITSKRSPELSSLQFTLLPDRVDTSKSGTMTVQKDGNTSLTYQNKTNPADPVIFSGYTTTLQPGRQQLAFVFNTEENCFYLESISKTTSQLQPAPPKKAKKDTVGPAPNQTAGAKALKFLKDGKKNPKEKETKTKRPPSRQQTATPTQKPGSSVSPPPNVQEGEGSDDSGAPIAFPKQKKQKRETSNPKKPKKDAKEKDPKKDDRQLKRPKQATSAQHVGSSSPNDVPPDTQPAQSSEPTPEPSLSQQLENTPFVANKAAQLQPKPAVEEQQEETPPPDTNNTQPAAPAGDEDEDSDDDLAGQLDDLMGDNSGSDYN
eukprot:TRINITY_DN68112_c0_g1_i1.p1 TRINITY_DN68112_c0_g1~~TRINITY_DN68112_c0_g1_i1.p1  ORF type:complete len:337 (-),score=76.50 TRINITY_DN68112_c0_g1_i1:1789-2799(-)